MKKIFIYIGILIIIPSLSFSETTNLAMTATGGVLYIYTVDENSNSTLINYRALSGGGWQPGHNFVDEGDSKFYIRAGGSSGLYHVYDYKNNVFVDDQILQDTENDNGAYLYQVPWNVNHEGVSIISSGIDAEDGSTTTILGSLDISDSNGNTLIENKADGSVHIGENSLVTQEVNGVQQLYATNSAGNQIDLNIKSGTNLLIDGRNIMDIISGDISGSVALSSALAALPNSSPDAFYTCGLGTGIHDSSSALSAGCASDFSNYAFVDNMPKIFQTASFNIGSSFLINGEPDISEARDMSIKAGITFKFGSVKPTRVADKQNYILENKIDTVMQENRTLRTQLKEENDLIREENDLLKAQIAEINAQLKALNMLAMN